MPPSLCNPQIGLGSGFQSRDPWIYGISITREMQIPRPHPRLTDPTEHWRLCLNPASRRFKCSHVGEPVPGCPMQVCSQGRQCPGPAHSGTLGLQESISYRRTHAFLASPAPWSVRNSWISMPADEGPELGLWRRCWGKTLF